MAESDESDESTPMFVSLKRVQRREVGLQKLREWLQERPGWTVETTARKSGKRARRMDKFCYSPDGHQFRTKKDAQHFIDTGERKSRFQKPKTKKGKKNAVPVESFGSSCIESNNPLESVGPECNNPPEEADFKDPPNNMVPADSYVKLECKNPSGEYYYSPDRHKFRSTKEAIHFLETGEPRASNQKPMKKKLKKIPGGQKQQESCSISLDVKSRRKAPARGGKKRVDVVHKKSCTDNSESIAVENHSEVDAFVPEQNNEQECPSEASNSERKTVLRRGSRLKMRPLEYWKGERFLYGRVDPNLVTVIGFRVVSPAKGGGKPRMRVKCLHEDYQELVNKEAY